MLSTFNVADLLKITQCAEKNVALIKATISYSGSGNIGKLQSLFCQVQFKACWTQCLSIFSCGGDRRVREVALADRLELLHLQCVYVQI